MVSDPAEPPAVLTRVEPNEIPRSGGTEVGIVGERFQPNTIVVIGARSLISPQFVSETLITGIAPAPDAGEPLGPRDVYASDERGTATLVGGVTYVEDPIPVLVARGPEQGEGVIAEGLIRYRWYNPIPYREIIILDENDQPVTVVDRDGNEISTPLPGTTQEVYLHQESRREAHHKVQGVTPEGELSRKTDIFATQNDCDDGVRITPRAIIGETEFALYGGHPPAENLNPCGGDVDCWLLGQCATDTNDLYSQYEYGLNVNGAGTERLAETGLIRTAAQLAAIPDRDKVVTGFTLTKDALKLEIGAYYQKTAPHPGGSLRGRLTLVRPFEAGVPLFDTEFEFPGILSGKPKAWNSAIVSRVCEGADYRPPECPDKPPADVLPMPAGDYLLEIYAVGGDREPYYLFGSDQHDEPKLIPGVPCPPYPAVEVTDVTGSDSLPEMDGIDAVAFSMPIPGSEIIYAWLQFRGEWKDACGVPHPIPSADPEDQNPSFQYEWVIQEKPPFPPIFTRMARAEVILTQWKCYYVTVTVRDLRCGASRTYGTQVSVYPQEIECPVERYHDFLFPTPDPGGIYGVAGLDPPPGGAARGEFQSTRPVEFRVMVVPRCDGGRFTPATAEDVRFELVNAGQVVAASNPSDPEGEGELIKVIDECGDVEAGKPKYFRVLVEDLGRLPDQFLEKSFQDVQFRAISVQYRDLSGTSHPVPEAQIPVPIGRPLHLTNSPPCLDHGYWSGYFDEKDESYHFTVKVSPEAQFQFADDEMRYSRELPLPIDVPGGVSIPSLESRLNVGLVTRFLMKDGVWLPEPATSMVAGLVLSNELNGAPLDVAPLSAKGEGLGADGGGGQFGEPYRWCHHEQILRGGFRQTLVETLLYAGAIGPVPVEMWGTIELGMDYGVDAYIDAEISPFAPLTTGPFIENHLYLLSHVKVYLPCGVRADVLFGVFSVAVRMVPEADFRLDTHVGVSDGTTVHERCVSGTLGLSLEAEACVDLLFWDECWGKTVTLLRDEPLFASGLLNVEIDPTTCDDKAAGGRLGGRRKDGGGDLGLKEQPSITIYIEESAPATAISPSGETTLDAYVDADGQGVVVIDGDLVIPVVTNPAIPVFHKVRDPAAAFLSDDVALVAFTRTVPDSPPSPADPQNPTLLERNQLAAMQDIYVYRYRNVDVLGWSEDEASGSPFAMSDAPGAPLADKRADGRPALVAAHAAPDPWAMLAWVRYTTFAFFADDGWGTMLQPAFNPILGIDELRPTLVHRIRPRLEATAIYTRRLDEDGTAIDEPRIISPPGINIEPALAMLPGGDVAYCVWVHDSTPGHKNLIDSNVGRRLLFSVYSLASDQWSPAADVVLNPDAYPGILEPSIAIRRDAGGNIDGILAFTAMAEDVPENHTGLYGSGRFIFVSYLEDGIFGEPVLLHERCAQRTEGFWVTVRGLEEPGDLVEVDGSHFRKPGWVVTWERCGPIGSPLASGGLMTSVLPTESRQWTDARSLTTLGQITSNTAMAAGINGIRTIHLDGGDGRMEPAAKRLKDKDAPTFRAMNTILQPDLAILSCALGDPFAAPGHITTVTIEIENRGLSGSALDESGASVVQLKATLLDPDGRPRDEVYLDVPEIAPGASAKVVVEDMEMMLDPVRVLVELDPNPGDSNPSNDTCELHMGVRSPENLRCEPVLLSDADQRLVAELLWTNPLEYEQIDIYRDGRIIVILPGTSTMFVDLYVEPGEHTYEVRGRIRTGASLRIAEVCTVEPPVAEEPLFRRGDADGNSRVEITDAVRILSYLYLGGPGPECPDAADADDNGRIEITDPIRILGYLYLGSAAPPAPGPNICGEDPTKEDTLPECVYPCP
ncbi:MAG: hypothetical protein JXA90_08360 [Planctomycetes bacterium]|nr:hypothetical protein [Planctomycetota bacterium]